MKMVETFRSEFKGCTVTLSHALTSCEQFILVKEQDGDRVKRSWFKGGEVMMAVDIPASHWLCLTGPGIEDCHQLQLQLQFLNEGKRLGLWLTKEVQLLMPEWEKGLSERVQVSSLTCGDVLLTYPGCLEDYISFEHLQFALPCLTSLYPTAEWLGRVTDASSPIKTLWSVDLQSLSKLLLNRIKEEKATPLHLFIWQLLNGIPLSKAIYSPIEESELPIALRFS